MQQLSAAPMRSQAATASVAGPSLPAWWSEFIVNVCELPDRNSPKDEPDAMVATADELMGCALSAMEHCGAAPQAVPALWQYRWTNPAGGGHPSPRDLEWREVVAANSRMQTMEERIEELRAYGYNGKPTYEVRPLYAHPAPAVADPVDQSTFSDWWHIHGAGWKNVASRAIAWAAWQQGSARSAPAVAATVQPLTEAEVTELLASYDWRADGLRRLIEVTEHVCATAWGVKLATATEEQK